MNATNRSECGGFPDFLTNPNPKVYLNDDYIVFDFETTNHDKGSALDPRNRIVLATWVYGREHRNYDGQGRPDRVHTAGGDLLALQRLVDAVESAGFIVAHNAKFELQWLQRLGVDIGKLLVYDTMLGEYVRLGNRQGRKDLDTVLERYGIPRKRSLVSALIHAGVCPSCIPERWLVEYGQWDTLSTLQAFLHQRSELDGLRLLPVLFTRCLATSVLADIERYGVKPDEDRVREAYAGVCTEHSKLDQEFVNQTGGINPRSSKQVAGFLYDALGFEELVTRRGDPDRTEAGGRRTDAESILRLSAGTSAQRSFQEVYKRYRVVDKQKEILGKLLAACEEEEGLLHAQFNQAVTQTHRLSSSGRRHALQFQNFPRAFKPLFKARHAGWLVGEADGAQLEFRVAGHLGRDPVAARDIRDGFDVHKFTASNLSAKLAGMYSGKPELLVAPASELAVIFKEVTKDERQEAKPETFRPLYGGRGQNPAAKRYAKAFKERWSGIADTQQGWAFDVLRDKQLRTESGLIFYWPDTRLTPSGYITNTTSIYNYPVQSFATAEIIPIALVYCWHRMRSHKLRSFLVNTIHDSIIGEIHPDETGAFTEIARQSLTSDCFVYLQRVYNVAFTVPLGCETKIGSHWGEGKAEDYNLDPESYD